MAKVSIATLYKKPGYLIRRLQQMAVSIFFEETADFDTTPVQYATLAAVAACPGLDQSGVAQTIGLDRTTVTGIIDRLEAKRLLTRIASKTDRRAKLLDITPAGLKFLDDIDAATIRVQNRILQPLKPSERKLFLDMLSRVVWDHNDESRVPVDRDRAKSARSEGF